MMKNSNLKQATLSYLKKNQLMAIATSYENKPWLATVFFAYDENFNLYFFSNPQTKHCIQIANNAFVAVAIHQKQPAKGFVQGIQYSGIAKPDPESYALYENRYKWAAEFPDHIVYRISPVEVYYLDSKLLGHHNRVRVV